jgi:hypothetical protein
MISLTSIAVAAAATSMKRADEGHLFRFTLRHSIFLASVIGLLVMFYAYVAPAWAPYCDKRRVPNPRRHRLPAHCTGERPQPGNMPHPGHSNRSACHRRRYCDSRIWVRDVEVEIKPPGDAPPSSPRSGR